MIAKKSWGVIWLMISGLIISPIIASADSSANVTFLPNPSLPLYPEKAGEKDCDKSDEVCLTGIDKSNVRKNNKQLPQTGEKNDSQLTGVGIVISALIIGYSGKRFLNNRAIKSRAEEL